MLSSSVMFDSLWPTDCSPPGSSVPGILHATILEWVAMPSSRGSSQHRDQTHISCGSCIGRCVLYHWATWEELPRCWLKPCVPGQAQLLICSTGGGQMASLLSVGEYLYVRFCLYLFYGLVQISWEDSYILCMAVGLPESRRTGGVLRSFNVPEPVGLGSTIRKWKRERS